MTTHETLTQREPQMRLPLLPVHGAIWISEDFTATAIPLSLLRRTSVDAARDALICFIQTAPDFI
jgi:hypothetical protein